MIRDVFTDFLKKLHIPSTSVSLLKVRVHNPEALRRFIRLDLAFLISCYLELTLCREDNFSNAFLFC